MTEEWGELNINCHLEAFDAFYTPFWAAYATNSTNAKPVNFISRTIENCFVPLVYSFLLSSKFCILKAL